MPIEESPRARLTITNVSTTERIEAQYNPTEWEIQLQANYATLNSPGAGYEIDQFGHTANMGHRLSLFYNVETAEDLELLKAAERFLAAFLYPRRGAGSIPQQSPPRALILWPNGPSFQCTIREMNVRASRFNTAGQTVEQTIDLTVKEYREGQLFSEDVARHGFRRPSPRVLGGRS